MKTFRQFVEAKIPKTNYIPESHPVREAITDIPTYWEKPDEAMTRISEILNQHGITITETIDLDNKLSDYRAKYHLTEHGMSVDSELIFAWQLMDSGRYEVVTSLS